MTYNVTGSHHCDVVVCPLSNCTGNGEDLHVQVTLDSVPRDKLLRSSWYIQGPCRQGTGTGIHTHHYVHYYMYSYGQIALAIARAITGHTRTSKNTDYCPNCTRKCVINYTKIAYPHKKELLEDYTVYIKYMYNVHVLYTHSVLLELRWRGSSHPSQHKVYGNKLWHTH